MCDPGTRTHKIIYMGSVPTYAYMYFQIRQCSIQYVILIMVFFFTHESTLTFSICSFFKINEAPVNATRAFAFTVFN